MTSAKDYLAGVRDIEIRPEDADGLDAYWSQMRADRLRAIGAIGGPNDIPVTFDPRGRSDRE